MAHLLLSSGAIVAACALAGPAAAAPSAPAPELRERAGARSEQGRQRYLLGDYRAAITAYRQAYMLVPNPRVLFNLGQAYRMVGDCPAATRAYRGFLRTEPAGAPRKSAIEQLAIVDQCVHDAESASSRYHRWIRQSGLAGAAIGVVALGAAGYFAIDAKRAEAAVEAYSRLGGPWVDIAATDRRGHRSSSLALGLTLGGGAALTTGVVVYLLGRHHATSPVAADVWVAAAQGGAVGGAGWRF